MWARSRRLRFICATSLLLFALLLLLRLAFYVGFSEVGDTVQTDWLTLWRTHWVGIRFDMRLTVFLMIPVYVLAYFPRLLPLALSLGRYDPGPLSHTWLRIISLVYLSVAMLFVLFAYIIDFGHYAYLGIRLDASVLRFLDDGVISRRMLWESYPVVWITLGWLLAAAVMIWLVQRFASATLGRPDPGLNKKQKFAGALLIFIVAFAAAFGRYSSVPLRWNHAFFSHSTTVGSLGLNPVLYFYDSYRYKKTEYDERLVRELYPDLAVYLGVDQPDQQALVYDRRFPATPSVAGEGQRAPNIIVIFLESLGASRLGIFGNPLQPSPVLDSVASKGWFLPNFYVPVSATAKTVFGSLTSLPDISPAKSATRNPVLTEQRSILNAFTEHRKFYFLGGSAGWAHMSALIQLSIPDIRLYEENDWSEPIVDVWGISDYSLFLEADRILNTVPSEQPFFAYIQTAANHRPFTIPEDRHGFEVQEIDEQEANRWGYRSADQFNAVRLLDYNIGQFFNMARDSGYFDNTIFVFFGDHNNRITTTPHMAPFYEVLDLDGLHVPGMIYGPRYLEPRVIEQATSLLDLMPTLAGLLGVPYRNTAIGRDINRPAPEGERIVFTQTGRSSAPMIGAISKDFMLRMDTSSGEARLHELHADDPAADVSARYPDKASRMKRLAKGIYETSKYLHYHNSPDKEDLAHYAPDRVE